MLYNVSKPKSQLHQNLQTIKNILSNNEIPSSVLHKRCVLQVPDKIYYSIVAALLWLAEISVSLSQVIHS